MGTGPDDGAGTGGDRGRAPDGATGEGATGDGALAVRTCGLTKRFGSETSVDGLSLRVRSGTIFGFIGPSGCGKTTAVRLLAGLYQPTGGTAEVLGREPWAFTRHDRERIGYLPQRPVLYPRLSISANLRFAASIYGLRRRQRERIAEVLEFVELTGHRRKRLSDASGGMQRRVGLAAALVHDPALLFLDEPTAGLDPILRAKLWEHFRRLRDEGRTLFVTTQYVSEAAYCDEVGVMVRGRLLTTDTPEGLRRRAVGGDVVRARARVPIEPRHRSALLDLPFVHDVRMSPTAPDVLDVVVDDAGPAMAPLVRFFEAETEGVASIERHLPPFDEVFVELVRQAPAPAGDPSPT